MCILKREELPEDLKHFGYLKELFPPKLYHSLEKYCDKSWLTQSIAKWSRSPENRVIKAFDVTNSFDGRRMHSLSFFKEEQHEVMFNYLHEFFNSDPHTMDPNLGPCAQGYFRQTAAERLNEADPLNPDFILERVLQVCIIYT